jgi:hypothetical protein
VNFDAGDSRLNQTDLTFSKTHYSIVTSSNEEPFQGRVDFVASVAACKVKLPDSFKKILYTLKVHFKIGWTKGSVTDERWFALYLLSRVEKVKTT